MVNVAATSNVLHSNSASYTIMGTLPEENLGRLTQKKLHFLRRSLKVQVHFAPKL